MKCTPQKCQRTKDGNVSKLVSGIVVKHLVDDNIRYGLGNHAAGIEGEWKELTRRVAGGRSHGEQMVNDHASRAAARCAMSAWFVSLTGMSSKRTPQRPSLSLGSRSPRWAVSLRRSSLACRESDGKRSRLRPQLDCWKVWKCTASRLRAVPMSARIVPPCDTNRMDLPA